MGDVAHCHGRVEFTREDVKGRSAGLRAVGLLFEANLYLQAACCQGRVRREGHHGARGGLRVDGLSWHGSTVAFEENGVSSGSPTPQVVSAGWTVRAVSLIMDAVADRTEVERNGLAHIPFVCPRDGWSREGRRAFIEGLRQRSGCRADRVASVVVKAGFDGVARQLSICWNGVAIAIVSGEGDLAVASTGRVDSMIYRVRRAVEF